ncbi:UDP-N-acetylmuramate dehydrogenase [Marinobacter adhaerens]|uniref:UDP-N-acetylmuramate dehydrogenase n=1 Tax=Marinobacter adhaerens TaxID=1033846 RepID=UPI003F726B7F
MDRLDQSAIEELKSICPGGLEQQVPLSQISAWGIGGAADVVIRPSSASELSEIRKWMLYRQIRPVVIGLTSNLLFADEGCRAPIIQIANNMASMYVRGTEVVAEAGTWVPGFSRKMMQNCLAGAEHICGIPGTLGGLICMNGGSQRKGVGSNVLKVQSVTSDGKVIERSADECEFGYRKSVFQSNGEIITAATLRFERKSDNREIRREMLSILGGRRKKFPRKLPNCGSVFKSNPAMYAEIGPPGAAIEKLGFKGLKRGGAQVSPMHANFIVNTGNAKAKDVLEIIVEIQSAVERNTGYKMEVEACYVSHEGKVMPADCVF